MASNTAPFCTQPTATPNRANCYNYDDTSLSVHNLTPRGSYTGSASPNGTYDQGGNVNEWKGTILIGASGTARILRGGGFDQGSYWHQGSSRDFVSPWFDSYQIGFRLANVPEPSTRPPVVGRPHSTGLRSTGA